LRRLTFCDFCLAASVDAWKAKNHVCRFTSFARNSKEVETAPTRLVIRDIAARPNADKRGLFCKLHLRESKANNRFLLKLESTRQSKVKHERAHCVKNFPNAVKKLFFLSSEFHSFYSEKNRF
jgi:hypothetical protein